ncbi:MAG: NUDIX domain-containing protein [Nocardioidaceae bacterium]
MTQRASGPADRPESWPVHASEDVWRGKTPFAVRRDTISSPQEPDEQFDRLVVEHPGAAVVLAVDNEDRALVLEQYRHPIGMRLVELPAGLLDASHEDPLEAARRELREEAMFEADTWSHLLSVYTSPGVVGERLEIFLAQDLSATEDRGDFVPAHEEADMTVSWVPVRELLDGVLAGELTDGPLALAVLAYTARGS